MPISLDKFNEGEDKFVRNQGLSFRGTVLEKVPSNQAASAEEVHAAVIKVEAFAEKSLGKTRTALNNLLRDGKISRRYVDNVAYYTQSGEDEDEEAEEDEDEE